MTSSTNIAVSEGKISSRVMEMREKIKNPRDLDFAIQRIAVVLSRRIVEDAEQHFLRRSNET
jgi:hypothetical protein